MQPKNKTKKTRCSPVRDAGSWLMIRTEIDKKPDKRVRDKRADADKTKKNKGKEHKRANKRNRGKRGHKQTIRQTRRT